MARKPKPKTSDEIAAVQPAAEAAPAEEYASEYRSRCGGALRTQREKQGLSTQTVATRLRLSVKQIEALEADSFEMLPEPTIARGFIRNYAKLLGISAEPLLDAYNVLVPGKTPHSFTVAPVPYAERKQLRTGELKRWIPLLAIALVAVGAWLFYQSYVQKPNPVAPTLNQLPSPEPLPEAALPTGERQSEATDPQAATTEIVLPPASGAAPTADATAPSSGATATATTNPVPSSTDAQVVAPTAPESAPVAVEPIAAPASTSKSSKLEFSATQETWVSVTDASGKEIFNKTLYAGNREVVEAAPPLNVVVGNANGANLSINGVETNLGPYTKVNVARIKVE